MVSAFFASASALTPNFLMYAGLGLGHSLDEPGRAVPMKNRGIEGIDRGRKDHKVRRSDQSTISQSTEMVGRLIVEEGVPFRMTQILCSPVEMFSQTRSA